MSEHKLPHCEEGDPGTEAFLASLEHFEARNIAIGRCLEFHGEAEGIDEKLKVLGRPMLEKKFLISAPGGNDSYPFSHDRVELHPKRGSNYIGIEAIVLRFATEPSISHGGWKFAGKIIVTEGLPGGQCQDYFLGEASWQPINGPEDLDIDSEMNVLKGVARLQPEAFTNSRLTNLLDFFEPALQDNRPPSDS